MLGPFEQFEGYFVYNLLSMYHPPLLSQYNTGFSSQGRARLREFPCCFTAENTQLSPSLTRKPCTLSKCTFKSDLFTIASFFHNAIVRESDFKHVNLRAGGHSLFSAQSEGPGFDFWCHPLLGVVGYITCTILCHGPCMQTRTNSSQIT